MSVAGQLGFRCGVTGKRRFKSSTHALTRAAEIIQEKNSPQQWRTYHCEYCGGYHLTKK